MKSLSKFTAHPVISVLTVLFIAWIVGNIFAPKALSGFYLTVWGYLFLDISVPLVVMILLAILLLALIFIVASIYASYQKKPAWFEYTSDIFLNVRWSWQYFSDGQLNSGTLSAYCTKDETPLIAERVPYNYKNRLVCETCGLASDEFGEGGSELLAKIKRMIVREIRTKYPDNK